ncbi:MAG: glycerol-3-phosphate dehydrogenase subunit GlpB [Deltaproteobacteria bacterium]|nr:glycerol-3-phosphate dehydrogenase subunit GlpB [Deltaproteobacteria bacterium]
MPEQRFDLAVVGAGLAGLCAALFAARKGAKVLVAGPNSSLQFASGFLDILAVQPVEQGRVWDHPFEAMAALVKDEPDHPYAKVGEDTVRRAMARLMEFLALSGLEYRSAGDKNQWMPTPAGTVKPTWAVPATMAAGAEAFRDRTPCVVAGIRGLKGFSARQVTENLAPRWPGISHVQAEFPGTAGQSEVFAERIARQLEGEAWRADFARALSPLVQGADCVALPAVLGMNRPGEVAEDLSARLAVPLFEIPTIPPAVPGVRLREAFLQGLSRMGVQTLFKARILPATLDPKQDPVLVAEAGDGPVEIHTKAVVLATGRFLGRGLLAGRKSITETVFGLPVTQPERRDQWHRIDFLDRAGHPVNRAGLETDELLRPLGPGGRPAHPRLFACGTILAHQDWVRQKCGAGLSASTALHAVRSALDAA